MRKTLVIGALLGLIIVSTLATSVQAFFWLGGCARCNGPTVVPVAPVAPAPVLPPAQFGERCGEVIGNLNRCINYCNWQAEGHDWDNAQAAECRGAINEGLAK